MRDWTVGGDVRLGQLHRFVEIAKPDRFEVVQATDRATALEHVSRNAEVLPVGARQDCSEMSASGVPRDIDPVGIEAAEFACVAIEPCHRVAIVADDLRHPHIRRQPVVDHRNVDVALQVGRGNVAEVGFVQRLPVSPVNEDQQRTALVGGREKIERLLGVGPVRAILHDGVGPAEVFADLRPGLEDVLEAGNPGPDVVLPVQLLLIEVSIH